MYKSTPGPWKYGWTEGITGPNAAAVLKWENAYPIRCKLNSIPGLMGYKDVVAMIHEDHPNKEANARLIAAAPDLLEALQSAKILLEALCGNTDDIANCVIEQAGAAITKATDEQE